jgi:hypothetical protein
VCQSSQSGRWSLPKTTMLTVPGINSTVGTAEGMAVVSDSVGVTSTNPGVLSEKGVGVSVKVGVWVGVGGSVGVAVGSAVSLAITTGAGVEVAVGSGDGTGVGVGGSNVGVGVGVAGGVESATVGASVGSPRTGLTSLVINNAPVTAATTINRARMIARLLSTISISFYAKLNSSVFYSHRAYSATPAPSGEKSAQTQLQLTSWQSYV